MGALHSISIKNHFHDKMAFFLHFYVRIYYTSIVRIRQTAQSRKVLLKKNYFYELSGHDLLLCRKEIYIFLIPSKFYSRKQGQHLSK